MRSQTIENATIQTNGGKYERRLILAASGLTLVFLATLHSALHFVSLDMMWYYVPWYQHIVHYGRVASIEGAYANYSPPYLYVLSPFTWLDGHLSPVNIIKLASVPFMVASAALFRSICLAAGCSERVAWMAAWIALVIPEVDSNTFKTGQCDIQSTAFILLFVRLMMARKPVWAMAAWGVALSFKLQPIFLGPVVLVLLLLGEIPWVSLFAVPAAYLAMMTPAALAGRPWKELLGVYTQQYGYYQMIAMNAANPYIVLLRWAREEPRATLFAHLGLVAGGLVTVALMIFLHRAKIASQPWRLIAAVGLTLVLEPYVLPKMHDRYFFAGNTIAVLLAILVPRMAWPAALLQAAALISYYATDYGTQQTRFWIAPVIMVGVAIYMLVRQLREGRPEDFARTGTIPA